MRRAGAGGALEARLLGEGAPAVPLGELDEAARREAVCPVLDPTEPDCVVFTAASAAVVAPAALVEVLGAAALQRWLGAKVFATPLGDLVDCPMWTGGGSGGGGLRWATPQMVAGREEQLVRLASDRCALCLCARSAAAAGSARKMQRARARARD